MDLFPLLNARLGSHPVCSFGLLERTDFNHWIGHLLLPPVGRPCTQLSPSGYGLRLVLQGDQKVCTPDDCTVIVRCTETF